MFRMVCYSQVAGDRIHAGVKRAHVRRLATLVWFFQILEALENHTDAPQGLG